MKAMQKKTTKRRKNERKPCPFCGSTSSTITYDYDRTFGQSIMDPMWVECDHCGAQGGRYCLEKDAIEHWNQRTGAE